MAEITGKRIGELQRGVFKILLDRPDGLLAKEVIQLMETVVPPTDFEKKDYPNNPGVQRFGKMVRFSTIAPVKAGWLIKDKGRWYLTQEGKQAFKSYPEPNEFRNAADVLYDQWFQSRPDADIGLASGNRNQNTVEVIEKAASVSSTYEEAEENAWTEIERHIQVMNPYDLQKLVAALLRAMGYHVSWDAPPGPDRGIDIIAHNDPLGTSAPRIKVQVKRRADKISVEGLRSFISVLSDQDVGIFISTGGFTSDAESEARNKETRKLTLLDLEDVVDLWIKNYERIDESAKRLLPLKPVYYLAPGD
jgi:restriction system protein